jgi:hypothetical protein
MRSGISVLYDILILWPTIRLTTIATCFYHDSFFPVRSWSRYSGNRLAFIAWCRRILTERDGWHDGVIMCKDGCHDDFSLSQAYERGAGFGRLRKWLIPRVYYSDRRFSRRLLLVLGHPVGLDEWTNGLMDIGYIYPGESQVYIGWNW